jgi:hypothetical protein
VNKGVLLVNYSDHMKGKYHEKGLTFTDESEKPPTTNDPSFEIDEQFNLWFHGIMIKTKYAH